MVAESDRDTRANRRSAAAVRHEQRAERPARCADPDESAAKGAARFSSERVRRQLEESTMVAGDAERRHARHGDVRKSDFVDEGELFSISNWCSLF